MSNTDKLREIARNKFDHLINEAIKNIAEKYFPIKECQFSIDKYALDKIKEHDDLLSDLTALISEGYVDKDIHDRLIERADELTTELEELKLKYDDLLQQRNELKEKLSEAIATIKAIKAVNDAAIK